MIVRGGMGMQSVKIIGAGSIGNHLTYACRQLGWKVRMTDIDADALRRTREEIYPARYGAWDPEIELAPQEKVPGEAYDLVVIGTPPDSHLPLAMEILGGEHPPKVLLIEKPLCGPALEGCGELWEAAARATVLIGYNHVMTANTRAAERVLRNSDIGMPLSITVDWIEHWGGIFAAHPWLDGPGDSYLGMAGRGGGACAEHSHGINLWQHFAHVLGMGRVTEVGAMLDIVKSEREHYDRVAQLHLRTAQGLVGDVRQDVITQPPKKTLRIQTTTGFLEWCAGYDAKHDAVIHQFGSGETQTELLPRMRPDDFKGEIAHVAELLAGQETSSPISLERGLETMLVVAAAHRADEQGARVHINYDQGLTRAALGG